MHKVSTKWPKYTPELISQIASATLITAFKSPCKNTIRMLLWKEYFLIHNPYILEYIVTAGL